MTRGRGQGAGDMNLKRDGQDKLQGEMEQLKIGKRRLKWKAAGASFLMLVWVILWVVALGVTRRRLYTGRYQEFP